MTTDLHLSRWRADTHELTETNLNWARDEAREWLRLKAPNGIFSPYFVDQIAHHILRAFERFGTRAYNLHVHCIFDAIGEIEQPVLRSLTGEARQFGPHPCACLNRLWHKHFFDPQFLMRNNQLELEKNFDQLWYGTFQKLREQSGLQSEVRVSKLAPLIAHAMTIEVYRQRAGIAGARATPSRITGEWIVFGRVLRRNVYLTVAFHEEAQNSGKQIKERLRNSLTTIEDSLLRTALLQEHEGLRQLFEE